MPIAVRHESDEEFIDRLELDDRVRVIGDVPSALWIAAKETHVRVLDDPVVPQGRLELRWYLREQAMSIRTHRYGNLVGIGEGALG